jgi:mannose/fructose-specific phosphotransferase system component IIA
VQTRDAKDKGKRKAKNTAQGNGGGDVAVVILSHGGLAPELLASARKIVARKLEHFVALPLEWQDGIVEGVSKLTQTLAELSNHSGVLVLTDIRGGTPFNVAVRFQEPGKIAVLSGVNLPMVVRLGCHGRPVMPVDELASWLREKSRAAICLGTRPGVLEPCGETCDG